MNQEDGVNQDEDVDMRILDEPDEEDGEEVQILTPPSNTPTNGPSTPPPAGLEQVNTISNIITTFNTSIVTDRLDPYLNQNVSFKVTVDSGSAEAVSVSSSYDSAHSAIPVNTSTDPVANGRDTEAKENEDEKSSRSSDVTYQSINTSYSKHGIKIKDESQGDDGIEYIEPEKPYMPSTYYQNKSARAALQSHSVKCVDFGEDTGTVKSVNFKSVSSLDCIGDTEVLKTFRGTRASSSGGAAHQSISFSFDPATLTCISCKSPHKIFESGIRDTGASTIIFCDQNFVPTLYGGNSCVAIARLEDGSLREIADLALEVLERQSVPPGTLILIGSASHLQHVGLLSLHKTGVRLSNCFLKN
jgi:hypothetical protein